MTFEDLQKGDAPGLARVTWLTAVPISTLIEGCLGTFHIQQLHGDWQQQAGEGALRKRMAPMPWNLGSAAQQAEMVGPGVLLCLLPRAGSL